MTFLVRTAGVIAALGVAAFAFSWAQTAALEAGPRGPHALTVDEIVTRWQERARDWGMFAYRGGPPEAAAGAVRHGTAVLTVPVRYARTGYLQNDVLLTGSNQIVVPRGTPVFARAAQPDATTANSQTRAWCAIVTERKQRVLCMFKTAAGVSVVAAGDRGSPHAPLSLARGAPATEAYVDEDFTAASAFPIMELVYSFVRWDDSLVYVDQGLRVDGDVVKLDELRLPRRPHLATLSEGRGALQVRPGRDQSTAVVAIAAPFVDEAVELRRAARAIVDLPPGEGVAASPDLLDPAGQPEIPAASGPAIPRIALPGPDPNRCMIASSDSASQAVRLTPGLFRARPTGEIVTRYFPREAVEARLDGRAVLLCAIDPGGGLRCLVQSETPEGWGFGEAALQIGSHFRVAERLPDGRTTTGGALRLPIRFCLP